MSDFSRRRRGFDGQTLSVTTMGESELVENRDKTVDLWTFGAINSILNRALKDPSFVHIRLIDEHGTTIFNRVQLQEVMPELQRLLQFADSDGEAEMIQEVLDVAQQVKDNIHTFLVFLGD